MAFDPPFEPEQHVDPTARTVLWIAAAISLLAHLSIMLFWYGRYDQPTQAAPAMTSFQIHLAPEEVTEPAAASPIGAVEPLADPIAKSQPPAAAESQTRDNHGETPLAPPPVPGRISILQSVDDYVANLPLSSDYLPQDTGADPGNIFSPKLRKALRAPERRRSSEERFRALNDSTVADAYERVALDDKCFRLENLGGGGDKRAWYPVKCSGSQTTSGAMARGLQEALDNGDE